MASKKAQVDVGVGGIQGGVKSLGDLKDALLGVEEAGKRLGATAKGLSKLWSDPFEAKGGWSTAQRTSAALAKMGAEIIGQQVTAASKAIVAPATSSYDQVLAKAREYRDSTQKLAIASGTDFATVGKQIMGTSSRLGLMPGQVAAYGKAIRNQVGGSLQEALSGIDAAQNQALRTGRSIEDLIDPVITLRNQFGLKSTEELNRFFNTMNAQASRSKVSVEQVGQSFSTLSGFLGRRTSATAGQQSALSSLAMQYAKLTGQSPEAVTEMLGTLAGTVTSRVSFIEAGLRKQGKLKKGQHLLDVRSGRLTPEGLLRGIEYIQELAPKHYQSGKDEQKLWESEAISGFLPDTATARFASKFDTNEARRLIGLQGKPDLDALFDQWLGSEAGKRASGEAGKERKDVGFGMSLIGAQDTAVEAGGGAAGIALASAGSVFSKAADVFSGAVNSFIGNLGKGGAASGAGAGAAGGAASGATTSGVAGRAAATVGGGATLGLAAGALIMSGDQVPGSQGEAANLSARQQELAAARARLAKMQAPAVGSFDWLTRPWGSVEDQKRHVADMESKMGGEVDYQKAGEANASALRRGAPLPVVIVQQPTAPAGPDVFSGAVGGGG
jgi:hypothetical protein